MVVEPSAVQSYFDKITHKFTGLSSNQVTAKELADLFQPIEGIDVESRVPEGLTAHTVFLRLDSKRAVDLCDLQERIERSLPSEELHKADHVFRLSKEKFLLVEIKTS